MQPKIRKIPCVEFLTRKLIYLIMAFLLFMSVYENITVMSVKATSNSNVMVRPYFGVGYSMENDEVKVAVRNTTSGRSSGTFWELYYKTVDPNTGIQMYYCNELMLNLYNETVSWNFISLVWQCDETEVYGNNTEKATIKLSGGTGFTQVGFVNNIAANIVMNITLYKNRIDTTFDITFHENFTLHNIGVLNLFASLYNEVKYYNQADEIRNITLTNDNSVYTVGGSYRLDFVNSSWTLSLLTHNFFHFTDSILLDRPDSKVILLETVTPDDGQSEVYSHIVEGTNIKRRYSMVFRKTGDPLNWIFFNQFPNGFNNTIAMILDDLPMNETEAIRLMMAHPRMKMCWVILGDNLLPGVIEVEYNEGPEWWQQHGPLRVLNLSCFQWHDNYYAWLCALQNNDTNVTPIAPRVTLGSHGYHHARPNANSTTDFEFESTNYTYSYGLLNQWVQDMDALGLDTFSMRVIRHSGFAYRYATIKAGVKVGLPYYTAGGYRISAPIYTEYGIAWVLSGNGPLWSFGTSNWSDLDNLLSRGYMVVTAGHFFEVDSTYDEVFDAAETKYPLMGYIFPESFGDFLNETHFIQVENFSVTSSEAKITFDGKATHYQTLIFKLEASTTLSDYPTVDGEKILYYRKQGEDIYLVLPKLADGLHTVVLPLGTKHDKPSIYFASETVSSYDFTNQRLAVTISAPPETLSITKIYIPHNAFPNDTWEVKSTSPNWNQSWDSISRVLTIHAFHGVIPITIEVYGGALKNDDFNDNDIDLTFWDKLEVGATVNETNQRLEVTRPDVAGYRQSGLVTKDSHDLTSATISVSVVELDIFDEMHLYISLTKVNSADPFFEENWYRIFKYGTYSAISVERRVNGSYSDLHAALWTAATGELKIVVSNGTIAFYENEVEIHSETYALSSYVCYVYVYFSSSSGVGTDAFDNFMKSMIDV